MKAGIHGGAAIVSMAALALVRFASPARADEVLSLERRGDAPYDAGQWEDTAGAGTVAPGRVSAPLRF